VLAENELRVDDANGFLVFSMSRPSTSFIKDPSLRGKIEGVTPIAFARRMEQMRSSIPDKEWRNIVKFWAHYLHESSETLRTYRPQDFCGAGGEVISALMDADTIIFLPLYMKDPDTGSTVPFPGEIGIIEDVATFVPSMLAHYTNKIRQEVHLKQAAHAFARVAKVALEAQKKYGQPGH
jgi:hypothetical protein